MTNIPAAGGVPGVPGSHHAQFIDVLHREHAAVEDGVHTNKAMGLRNLPYVEDLDRELRLGPGRRHRRRPVGWCRLLGLHDQKDLKDAEPDTLRYRLWALPARLARHARQRVLKISRTWP